MTFERSNWMELAANGITLNLIGGALEFGAGGEEAAENVLYLPE